MAKSVNLQDLLMVIFVALCDSEGMSTMGQAKAIVERIREMERANAS